MVLHIIGLGLKNEQSVTKEGHDLIQTADVIYLETYTSILTNASKEDLEQYYGKEIIPANRELVESGEEILENAAEKNVALLVVGDPFSATTHIDIYNRAKEKGIEANIVNNVSILNAIGIVGLELYKYGKITSVPFDNENVTTPYDVFKMNKCNGLHTLFLLDLHPEENKFMSCKQAADYLIAKGLDPEETVISCAQIGGSAPIIKVSKAQEVEQTNVFPQCLIIPGELHFVEEEFIMRYA